MKARSAAGPRARMVSLTCVLVAAMVAPSGVSAGTGSTTLSATYDVAATLNYSRGSLAVKSTANVVNNTSGSISQLIFNLATLRVGHALISSVTVGQQSVGIATDDQSVIVTLPFPLVPGAAVPVTTIYSATLTTTTSDKNWLFAKQQGTVSAYRWIPWLSERQQFDRPNFGSPFVTGVSANVNVMLTSDVNLTYGTSGRQTSVSSDGRTRTFAAANVRDFNFVADPNYAQLTGWWGATKILVLTKSLGALTLLDWAQKSLSFYAGNVGPYTYPALVVAETPTGTSMESPGMVWITANSGGSNLAYRVAHEIAHQWFYAMIGSNQATQPFADEAPADFLARRLLTSFRSPTCATQRLDGTVWDYSDACYYEVVYIEGGNYINDYRKAVGNDKFWAGMHAYYTKYLNRLGGTRQFWNALDAASGYTAGHADRFPTLY